MTFYIGLGHSHVVALAKGAYRLRDQRVLWRNAPIDCGFHYLYDAPFHPALDEAGGLNPAVAALLSPDSAFALLSLGGNEHNILAIGRAQPYYDFILGSEPDLPLEKGAHLLPEAAAQEALREKMQPALLLGQALRAVYSGQMFYIEPPAPLPRARVLERPDSLLKDRIAPKSIAPEAFRYKLWRLQTQILQAFCAANGVDYVAAPEDTRQADGMLAQAYWGADATHANETFGEIMARRALSKAEASN